MKNQINIHIAGANGRMGKEIIKRVMDDADLWLAGASEHLDSPVLGADAGLNAGMRQASVSITSDLKRPLEKSSGVIIDFSSLESTLENLKRAVQYSSALVIGTTGFNQEQVALIQEAAKKIPIMFAPNMSVGMNVLFKLVSTAAQILKDTYDIEVLEAHHKDKLDAPSGSALKIAQVLCESAGFKYPESLKLDRHNERQAREPGQIGVQSLRGGDVVGDHTVYFYGKDERLEVKHVATSRKTFAGGAVMAAKWIFGKKPGLYDMQDVLGLS